MAVVLPFCEFVETGYAAGVQMHLYAVHRYNRGSCSVGTGQRPPIDPLPMRGARCRDNASFERSLSALVTRVLLPAVRRAAVHCIVRIQWFTCGAARRRGLLWSVLRVCHTCARATNTRTTMVRGCWRIVCSLLLLPGPGCNEV